MTYSHRITRYLAGIILLVIAGCNGGVPQWDGTLPERVDYNFHIRPILSDRCYACHGPDGEARQAELRLDEEDNAKHSQLPSGGYAIVPGNVRKSQLFQRITASDPADRMPPQESNLELTEQEIAMIHRWLEQGAQWKPHWSFVAVEPPAVPEIDHDCVAAT